MNCKSALVSALAAIAIILSCEEAHAEIPAIKASKDYKKIPVKVTGRIELPRWYHEGLLWNDGDVWVANGEGGRTWIVESATGKVKSEISSIAGFTEGIARIDCSTYAVTDWNEKKVYKAVVKDGWFVAIKDVSVAPAFPAGICSTEESLYAITWTRGPAGTRFDLLEMDSELVIKRKLPIKRIQEPAHLAFDGKHLWITSWYSKMVYKVDPAGWAIEGWFTSPVSRTTGIAWDGTGFWLTGTYGDLYRVVINGGGEDMNINVESPAFKEGGPMPRKFTCDGENISPALKWSGVPAGAKSIALVCDDPDAPRGTWVHWIRFNIPPDTVSAPEAVECGATLPDGSIQLVNDSGSQGYDGPCPPSGTHRYYFKVYALREKLSLSPSANKRDFYNAINGRILAEGSMMATYRR